MLSSITPLGERGRSGRWPVTAAAYVAGSIAAAAALGALLGALGGAVARAAGEALPGAGVPPAAGVLAGLAALAVVGVALDTGGRRAAHPRSGAPGRRGLARPLPRLGLRRRVRRPARARRHHDRHDVDGAADLGGCSPERVAGGGRRRGRGVRTGPRRPGPAAAAGHDARRAARRARRRRPDPRPGARRRPRRARPRRGGRCDRCGRRLRRREPRRGWAPP